MKNFFLSASLVLFMGSSAYASTITYGAVLNGANESPANASAGTGIASVVIDTIANTMDVSVSFSGLSGTTAASHIHCCTTLPFTSTAGVATQTPTFINFPLGVTSGTYEHVFDLGLASTYNPAFVTVDIPTTEAAFLAGMAAGKTYLNIHTSVVPGGEIRGFLVATPEPASLLTAAFALGVLVPVGRRLRNRRVSS